MRSSIVVDALGLTVKIQTDHADAAAVRDAWSGARSGAIDSERVVNTGSPVDLASLSISTTLEAIAGRKGELLMFHACGLVRADGAVAAFVAASGTGKTTLARTLGTALGYLSDETVAVEFDGTVHPYRKPLSIIEQPGAPKAQRSPGSIALLELPDAPLRIAALVLLDRDEAFDSKFADIQHVGLIDALPSLVPQISYLGALPNGLGALAALSARVGGVVRVHYREAIQIQHRLDEVFERGGRSTNSATSHGVTVPPRHGVERTGWTQTDDVQWLDDGERVATFDRTTVRILEGVGAAVWRSLDVANDIETITHAVVTAIGPAPSADASALVLDALHTLRDAGLVSHFASAQSGPH